MASAVECLHTYSLVHDDLPSMDDDKFRRGQKSSHIKYDEPTAILVGDSLQALSFELLVQAEPPYPVIADFAQAVGGAGMVGGQFMDLKQDNIKMNMGILNKINFLKTGRLFQMSVAMPLKFTNLRGESLYAYENWGKALGHLFQITDDLEEHKQESKQTKEDRSLSILDIISFDEALSMAYELQTTLSSQAKMLFPKSVFLQSMPLFVLSRAS